jgi:hypothetical protein
MKAAIVTDHCLLRYIERVKGVDLDVLRAEIVAIVGPAVKCGATSVSSAGFTYCLAPTGAVKTIVPGATPNGARMKAIRHNGKSIRLQRDARP